ncbi:hypothetical protein [Streptomyces ardesiacus]|uniref:hypothetical protein n=1 Tax=Streptomyces ardesiacus TaxID=285564 RepID=UPI0036BB6458
MKPLKRLTASLFLTAVLAGGSLAMAGTAAADDAGTPDTSTTQPGSDGTDDTWWGSQPSEPAPGQPAGPGARPADTWWG